MEKTTWNIVPDADRGMIDCLVSFILQTDFEEIPSHVRTLAKRSIIGKRAA